MNKHPVLTYFYVYIVDIVALIISIYSLKSVTWTSYDVMTLVNFTVWTMILVFARSGGFFDLRGLRGVMTGWAVGIEFACLIVLPFELFIISLVISVTVIMFKRLKQKHAEPFLGPDFNGSNLIISGFLTMSLYYYLESTIIGEIPVGNTLNLVISIIVYTFISFHNLTCLLVFDLKKSYFKVGTYTKDSVFSSLLLIASGGIIGYLHKYDPFLIILLLVPLILLHNSLNKISESKLIYIDEKTGLHNYRYFDEKLSKMFIHAKKTQTPLSIIFGDMDYLRDINNNYGHSVGDKAIIAVAQIFSEYNSPNVAARFGGEEFVLIAPSDKKHTVLIAEQIRQKISESVILTEEKKEVSLSISLGVATYPEDATNAEDLTKAADDALYYAKNLGRNQVQIFHPEVKKELMRIKASS